jgi:hypothetical protein
MAGEVAAALAVLRRMAEIPVGSLGIDELPDVLSELAVLEARVGAIKLDVLAEADRRQIADQTGDTGTDAWAAKLTGTTRGVMSGGIWLANLLLRGNDSAAVSGRVEELAGVVDRRLVHTVIVSSEVGLGLVPETPLGRAFRDVAGLAHQRLAGLADEVYFGVLGVMLRLKPGPVVPAVGGTAL